MKTRLPEIVITRRGPKHLERAVRVHTIGGPHCWLNPQTLIASTTGVLLPRQGCVPSFADGLVHAGFLVTIDDQTETGRLVRYPHQVFSQTVAPPYYLLGRAFGLGIWDMIAAQLRCWSPPSNRHKVLEYNGQIWLRHPEIKNLKLMVTRDITFDGR